MPQTKRWSWSHEADVKTRARAKALDDVAQASRLRVQRASRLVHRYGFAGVIAPRAVRPAS
jgi:hypothetical protein